MTAVTVSNAINRRNRLLLAIISLVVAGMVGMAYESVPLYKLFCQVTGFGGQPR